MNENSNAFKKEGDVSTTFHKYIFEDNNQKDKKFNFLEEVASIFEDDLKGVHEVNGKENSSSKGIETEINSLVSQLESVGFSKTGIIKNNSRTSQQTALRENISSSITSTTRDEDNLFLKPEVNSLKTKITNHGDNHNYSHLKPTNNGCSVKNYCSSTPTRKEIPRLDVSQVSSIGAREESSILTYQKVNFILNEHNSLSLPLM